MDQTLRSPWYLAPFVALIAVTVVSLVLAQRTSSNAVAAPGGVQAAATRTATPTQSAADARRTADLAAIGKLLETYKAANGTYPTTERYFTTLCQRAFDAGCLLTTIAKGVPFTDGSNPYWYRSDGRSYSVFAAADAAAAPNNCPSELPPALAGKAVLCVNSAGGGQ
ncbi:MAG TPA: type II secretion system protein GspG [Dehalococcoidia bacterium]|nr:type II secretion system protein GspG [Dehalococcoidia bacterium]